jgi:hypothetical protein
MPRSSSAGPNQVVNEKLGHSILKGQSLLTLSTPGLHGHHKRAAHQPGHSPFSTLSIFQLHISTTLLLQPLTRSSKNTLPLCALLNSYTSSVEVGNGIVSSHTEQLGDLVISSLQEHDLQ